MSAPYLGPSPDWGRDRVGAEAKGADSQFKADQRFFINYFSFIIFIPEPFSQTMINFVFRTNP